MELSQRTLKRWRRANGTVAEDQRLEAERVVQPHQLTHAEEAAILDTCNEREYQSLPPSQIVPRLADKGLYLASESSFYRVLAYSGEREHSFRLNVNTFFFNALPTEVFTPGVHVQSIS